MQLTRVHSALMALMASRVHSSLLASRVNAAPFIFGPRKPSLIPDKPSTLPNSNAVTSIYSGSMIGIANYPFYLSRSSFSLSRKGFEPTYEVFARRLFSVNAKTKTMPQDVDLSPATTPKIKMKATRSRKKEKSPKDNPEEAMKTKTMHKEVDLSHSAPKKKATTSTKEKSVKACNTKLKISDALPKPHEPYISKLPQQPKPPSVNGINSIKLKPLYPPVGKSVVVVESPTKAKVIQLYLGDMYQVLPSYGHVRDLAATFGSVQPDDDFSMVWEVSSPAWIHLESMKVVMSG